MEVVVTAAFAFGAMACKLKTPTPEAPTNPGLEKALQDIRGALTRDAALHFYAELNKATLLLAQSDAPSHPGPGVTTTATPMAFLTTTDPDGKVWLPAFTNLQHLRFRFPDAKGYLALPTRAVAEMVLKDSTGGGLVLNPGEGNAGAQPVERHGLEAVARGETPTGL